MFSIFLLIFDLSAKNKIIAKKIVAVINLALSDYNMKGILAYHRAQMLSTL